MGKLLIRRRRDGSLLTTKALFFIAGISAPAMFWLAKVTIYRLVMTEIVSIDNTKRRETAKTQIPKSCVFTPEAQRHAVTRIISDARK
jgi:hypothetical protein